MNSQLTRYKSNDPEISEIRFSAVKQKKDDEGRGHDKSANTSGKSTP